MLKKYSDYLFIISGFAFLSIGVAGFYFFKGDLFYSWSSFLIGFLLFLVTSSMSKVVQRLFSFLGESKIEFLKIIWPERDDATNSLIIVVIFALFLGFFVWFLDTVFFNVYRFILNIT
jgi:preprotein translocase subunit SecE